MVPLNFYSQQLRPETQTFWTLETHTACYRQPFEQPITIRPKSLAAFYAKNESRVAVFAIF